MLQFEEPTSLNCIGLGTAFSDGSGCHEAAISPDGSVLYHVDTLGGTVYACDKQKDGRLNNRRVFAQLDPVHGSPDGLTVDALGYIWLAHFGGSRITRIAPDGKIEGVVKLPAPQVTSCTFGGRN